MTMISTWTVCAMQDARALLRSSFLFFVGIMIVAVGSIAIPTIFKGFRIPNHFSPGWASNEIPTIVRFRTPVIVATDSARRSVTYPSQECDAKGAVAYIRHFVDHPSGKYRVWYPARAPARTREPGR